MKITAFNGSSRGHRGNTHVMVETFLEGAAEAGAEVDHVHLIEKEIRPCTACVSCWVHTPGECVQRDDEKELLEKTLAADVILFASPLYVHTISGTMKNFLDRMIPLVDPHFAETDCGETHHVKSRESFAKIAVLANGGFPEQTHYEITSMLFHKIAMSMHTEVIAEIYRGQGNLMRIDHPAVKPIVDGYKELLKKAGREVVENGRLSQATRDELEKPLVPKEIYNMQANKMWDKLIAKAEEKKKNRDATRRKTDRERGRGGEKDKR